ncbi:MAG: hypothetical protein LCH61_19240 [Proteobacteria bacterium]|nr:hypothetical protein [Pseudomonadota bacterium]
MAFSAKSLARVQQLVVGDASGNPTASTISAFRYATADAAATVETAGYFNGARALLTVGSIIVSVMAIGGTPVLKSYVVTAVPASGNVTVALQATTAG